MFVEINLYKKKWLIGGTYNPCMISNHIGVLSTVFTLRPFMIILILWVILMLIPLVNDIKEFCDINNLKNLVKDPTCYKNMANPTCIDLILTNRKFIFYNTKTIETGLSDFHKMTVTVAENVF